MTALETENTPLADMRPAAQAARRIAVDVVPVIADVMHNLTRLERQSFSGENVQNSEESPRVTARKNGGCHSVSATPIVMSTLLGKFHTDVG